MPRITQVRIRNVRAIESVDLDLGNPITVLIGENGAGKSTIMECLELLRKVADPGFMQQFYTLHRGMPGLLRRGAQHLTLGVTLTDGGGDGYALTYDLAIEVRVQGAVALHERLMLASNSKKRTQLTLLQRADDKGSVWVNATQSTEELSEFAIRRDALLLSSFGSATPSDAIVHMLNALRAIEVHVAFDSRASWVARTFQRPESIRGSSTLFPADRLNLMGGNLANAWYELNARAEAERQHTIALLRLGMGDRVDSVIAKADMGGGNVYLAVRYTDLPEPIFAADLSDGQLAWLAFVAMTRLNPGRSLLAIDEPELHLHPSLLGRVVTMLANLPGGAPVVLSTHSDRVLELLDNPADALRVCTLNGSRAEVSRIDAEQLPRWLEQFGDLGQLRAAGYLSRVLVPTSPAAPKAEGAE